MKYEYDYEEVKDFGITKFKPIKTKYKVKSHKGYTNLETRIMKFIEGSETRLFLQCDNPKELYSMTNSARNFVKNCGLREEIAVRSCGNTLGILKLEPCIYSDIRSHIAEEYSSEPIKNKKAKDECNHNRFVIGDEIK